MGELIEMAQEILVAGEKSDQELIDEGKRLVKLAGRGLGEWFNRVKLGRSEAKSLSGTRNVPDKMTARQICAAIPDMSYSTAKQYGQIVTAFPTEASQRGFTWTQCHKMMPAYNHFIAAGQLDEFHETWMERAVAGEPYRRDPGEAYIYTGPWSNEDIRRQVSLLTKNKLPAKSDKLSETTLATVANLDPVFTELKITKRKEAKVRAAVAREVKRIEKDVKGHFIDEVNAAADKIAMERTKELREIAEVQRIASTKAREKYERGLKVVEAREKRLPMFMTKSEFKLIQNCLHPDRVPEDRKTKFTKAFDIFNRLAESVDW